jgi:hypothetical protein
MTMLKITVDITPVAQKRSRGIRNTPLKIAPNTALTVERTVTWALTSLSAVATQLTGKRLILTAKDHKGESRPEPLRTLKFINKDIQELVLPESFLCEFGRELINELEGKLILKMNDFKPGESLESKMAHLYLAREQESGELYGVLALNNYFF